MLLADQRPRQVSDAVPSPQCERATEAIRNGFETYRGAFTTLTRRAARRFAHREWTGAREDSVERLALYAQVVARVVAELTAILGPSLTDTHLWSRMKCAYAEIVAGMVAGELAETFFNSVTRRIFTTVGVNPHIEFVDFHFERLPSGLRDVPYRVHTREGATADLVYAVLNQYELGAPYRDAAADAVMVAEHLEDAWRAGTAPLPLEAIEMLDPVFYRRKGAYLIGRVVGGNRVMPLVIALSNSDDGVSVDAAVFSERDVSVIFSFTRSYFFADVRSPFDVLQFLATIMPQKPVAELYNALGDNKHGKTELYRSLQRHLAHTDDRFTTAPGAPGTVMMVFTMPGLDVVFKVIRDTFDHPKRTTRGEVMRRYQLVFGHDRAGRLVDAQEFEHLTMHRGRFAPGLLNDLLHHASRTVTATGDHVVFKHVYIERRVKPLDVCLRDADAHAALRLAREYGQAIRDLAATDVFPGDLLLKNFGVTRHGRVVFYDYDELRLLGECRFEAMPQARTPEDELSAEPWFYVGPDTVFPEELPQFLELTGDARREFFQHHRDIFDARFWCERQARNAAGEVFDVYPYPPERRLARSRGAALQKR
jgi:isocitrate dehydrogenase kinase/phosphatase